MPVAAGVAALGSAHAAPLITGALARQAAADFGLPDRDGLELVRHPGRAQTHRQLLTAVWGPAHVEDVG